MIKMKNILLEKREFDSKYVQKVDKMTNSNNHTEARIYLSMMLRNKKGDHMGIGKNQFNVLSAMWLALSEYEENN